MTDDKLYDIFDLDIDFETAYNMLENSEIPMTNLMTSPKQLLILSPKKNFVQDEQPRQMTFAVDEKPYTFDTWDAHNTPNLMGRADDFNDDVSLHTEESSVPVAVQDAPKERSSEFKDEVLGEQVAMTFDGPGTLGESKKVSEPDRPNNLLYPAYNPNPVFVPSRRPTKGKLPSYDLLSVNESHAIENFLDSLMDNPGNSEHLLPDQGRPLTPLVQSIGDSAHDQLLSSFVKPVKAEAPHSYDLEPNTAQQIDYVEKKTQAVARPPILTSSNSVSIHKSVPHSIGGGGGGGDGSAVNEEKIGYEELSARYNTIMEKINVKKNKHLTNERKRRAAIKTSFDLLKSRIRYPRNDGFDEKVSKIRVKKYEQLQFVIEDIEGLLLANEQLRQKIRDLGQWHNYENTDKSA